LDGRPAPHLAELMQPFPVAWERQRTQFVGAPMQADHALVTVCERRAASRAAASRPNAKPWSHRSSASRCSVPQRLV
jgi:hypothetical protein